MQFYSHRDEPVGVLRPMGRHLAPCGTGHVSLIIRQYVVKTGRKKTRMSHVLLKDRKEEMERVRSVPMVEACLPPGAMAKSFCVPIKHKTYLHRRHTRFYPDFGIRYIS